MILLNSFTKTCTFFSTGNVVRNDLFAFNLVYMYTYNQTFLSNNREYTFGDSLALYGFSVFNVVMTSFAKRCSTINVHAYGTSIYSTKLKKIDKITGTESESY